MALTKTGELSSLKKRHTYLNQPDRGSFFYFWIRFMGQCYTDTIF